MVEVKSLTKREDGTIVGVFERELSEDELNQAQNTYNVLVVREGELITELQDIRYKITEFNGVFEEDDDENEDETEEDSESSNESSESDIIPESESQENRY